MKVYIGPYKNWVGPYQLAKLLKYVGVSEQRRDIIADYLADTWVLRACQWFYDKFPRKVKVKVHYYDVWNMDNTLSMIILPLFKELKNHKYSSPLVDNEDVPDEIQYKGELEYLDDEPFESIQAKWSWVLDEMIWTFEQLQPDSDWEDQFHEGTFDKDGYTKHQDRINNGLRLFGKYYQTLWT